MRRLFLLFFLVTWGPAYGGDAPLILMRHALAPGTGDPAEFSLEDCSTQRNLSEEGRAQARRAGELLRAQGIPDAVVLTSAWCRCRETAELLNLGEVEGLPALNSFFREREREAGQMQALRRWIRDWDGARPVVMVTHQVVMTSLIGEFPASGEMWWIRRGPEGALVVEARTRVPVGDPAATF